MGLEVLDELESLVGSEGAGSASAVDFSGSLEYIDSLADKPVLSISGRDASDIAMVLGLEPDTMPQDFKLQSDNRRFSPDVLFDPGEVLPGSSSVVDRLPLDPDRSDEEIADRLDEIQRRALRQPFKNYHRRVLSGSHMQFSEPDWLEICLRRKMRRAVMHALGLSGHFYLPRHRNWTSLVRC